MSTDDANVVESLQVMIDNKFRHMPVVSARGALAGLFGGLRNMLSFSAPLGSTDPEVHLDSLEEVVCMIGIDDILQAVAQRLIVEKAALSNATKSGDATGPGAAGDDLVDDDSESVSTRSFRSGSVASEVDVEHIAIPWKASSELSLFRRALRGMRVRTTKG